jgi:hypothetical protein
MPPYNETDRPAVERFHQAAMNGELEAVQAALAGGVDVNALWHGGQTALMLALQSKHLPIAKLLIEQGADLELADDFNSTALRHAVDVDFAEGVRLLLGLGVDRGRHPRDPLKKLALDPGSLPMQEFPEELKGAFTEEQWAALSEEMDRDLLAFEPTAQPIIGAVQSVEVLELFLAMGDDVNLAPRETKRAWVGLTNGGELSVAPRAYKANKGPRFGTANPERMNKPFWQDMIRVGCNAHTARTHFKDPDPFPFSKAVWCYDRFGSTITRLGDGRFVEVGGEHEDFYDPDFYIYNDVVIHDGHGAAEIYGYPSKVFRPTDGHTATLCPDGIYLIGCLGYPDDRQAGFTPVYLLELDSWRITPVETTGEMPGWINGHQATYNPDQGTISVAGGTVHVLENGEGKLVPNEQEFVLDLETRVWRQESAIKSGLSK